LKRKGRRVIKQMINKYNKAPLYCIISILIIIFLGSCTDQKNNIDSSNIELNSKRQVKNVDEIQTCYWHNLKNIKTPNGVAINYTLANDSTYHISWGKENTLRTLPQLFYCDAPVITRPYLVEENKDYLVLRFGCGSTYWAGIFLPLYAEAEPQMIPFYYDYDLENNLVAYLDSGIIQPTVSIINLKTTKTQQHVLGKKCESAIPTYCLDSLSIQGGELYYKWAPSITLNADISRENRIKL